MDKPEFPKPRLIREGFLPEQDPMKNYRIKKVTEDGETKYFPQYKFLGLFWRNMFGWDDYWDGSYSILEVAQERMCDYLRKPVIEYLEVDCDCGD